MYKYSWNDQSIERTLIGNYFDNDLNHFSCTKHFLLIILINLQEIWDLWCLLDKINMVSLSLWSLTCLTLFRVCKANRLMEKMISRLIHNKKKNPHSAAPWTTPNTSHLHYFWQILHKMSQKWHYVKILDIKYCF